MLAEEQAVVGGRVRLLCKLDGVPGLAHLEVGEIYTILRVEDWMRIILEEAPNCVVFHYELELAPSNDWEDDLELV